MAQPERAEEIAEALVADRRAVWIHLAGERRLIAAEDAGRYRDGLGAMPPSGVPEAFLEPVPEALRSIVAATPAATGPSIGQPRGPLRARAAGRRAGAGGPRGRRDGGARRAAPGRIGARVVRRRGGAAAAARASPRCGARSSRPTRGRSGASCPTGSASTGPPRLAGPTRCATRSRRSRAWRSRRRSGSPRCCRGAWPMSGPAGLDELAARGEIVWVGAGAGGVGSGRVAIYFREDAPLLGPPPRTRRPRGRCPRPCAPRWPAARASGTTCWPRPPRRARRSSRRCGGWSGRARSPTTSGCRCGPRAACRCAAPRPDAGAWAARPPCAVGGGRTLVAVGAPFSAAPRPRASAAERSPS